MSSQFLSAQFKQPNTAGNSEYTVTVFVQEFLKFLATLKEKLKKKKLITFAVSGGDQVKIFTEYFMSVTVDTRM